MTRVRGGRARTLTNLQARTRAFDRLDEKARKGRTRPGSNNRRKQA